MQKGMRLLPGAWPMLSEEAPQQSVTDSTGAGRQGGIPENQFHHTVGTAAQFLVEAELFNRGEMDAERHLATR